MRVQADSAAEAEKIAKDRFRKTPEFTFKEGNMDRQIVMLRMREEPCNLEATNQDMVYEYKHGLNPTPTNGETLEEFLYEKCRQDPDLLATIINEYVCSLSDSKVIQLEDFLTNNFGDN